MQLFQKQSRLFLGISLFALGMALAALLLSTSHVTAQSSENATMADLLTTLNDRVQNDKTFQFNINIPYSFYNQIETFTVDNDVTKISEIADDHVCMDYKKSNTDPLQTFCYPYTTISVVYPIPK